MDPEVRDTVAEIRTGFTSRLSAIQSEQHKFLYNWLDTEREVSIKVEQNHQGTEWEVDATVYSQWDYWHTLEMVAKYMLHLWTGRYGPIWRWRPKGLEMISIILNIINDKQRKITRRNYYYPHRTRLNIIINDYFHLSEN